MIIFAVIILLLISMFQYRKLSSNRRWNQNQVLTIEQSKANITAISGFRESVLRYQEKCATRGLQSEGQSYLLHDLYEKYLKLAPHIYQDDIYETTKISLRTLKDGAYTSVPSAPVGSVSPNATGARGDLQHIIEFLDMEIIINKSHLQ